MQGGCGERDRRETAKKGRKEEISVSFVDPPELCQLFSVAILYFNQG